VFDALALVADGFDYDGQNGIVCPHGGFGHWVAPLSFL
jgi:hypothetical protein